METIGTFDIFKSGVGPSSSHTMDPWRAAQQFINCCRDSGIYPQIARVCVDLYGSLANSAKVSLDVVIRSMWETALDINTKYKETSEGGLAVQIPVNLSEC